MAFLDQAIEDLYLAFADVPAPRHIESCPCCSDDETQRRLLRNPRRQATPDDLARYAHKAITTQGSAEDFLYFFPRIVELMVTEPGWGPNWEIVFGKIGLTDPSSWPSGRRAGFDAFVFKAIEGSSHYAEDPTNIHIDDLVCGLGRTTLPIEPYLAALLAYPELVADFHEYNIGHARDGVLRNAFWGNKTRARHATTNYEDPLWPAEEAAQRAVIAWLSSPEVEELLTSPD